MKNIKNLPHASGIYLVENTAHNNTPYIGQAVDLYKRFNSHHISDYKNPNNCCYNTKFYIALRKYGIENFKVTILELCPIEKLDEKEIFYIEKYNSFHQGYNSTQGGQFWTQDIHSAETEEKRRITREKNQSLKSENHPRAKLTNQEVVEIRQRYIDGESVHDIYADYSELYSNEAVFKRIVLGSTYVSAGNIPDKSQIRYTNAKLTATQIREIRKKYKKGVISYDKLGAEYGVSGGAIASIVKRRTYKHID